MLISVPFTQAGPSPSAMDAGVNDASASLSGGQPDQAEASSVVVTLSQTALDFLAGSSAGSQSQSSAQQALARLDQIIQSSHATARQQAEQRLDSLKAQMFALMEMGGILSPRAMAAEVARLAHQLAAAVAQYAQNGGTATVSTALATDMPAAPQDASSTDTAATVDGTGQDLHPSTDGTQAEQPPPGEPAPAAQPAATTDENQQFRQAASSLASQMMGLLRESERHLKKPDAALDSDLTKGRNALDMVVQLLPAL
ncbi:hypothetical protein K2X14_02150 [Acetobacter sp. TBRC 12305]|uniref:Uncharacterized protein n=1 Tax=Acetobacter garciniae TaxID=2817435 RepID=A0A939HJM6_9PROT|nr:hypothetical protein [Acetobacter garciniae]MBO1323955.1 hypothetical protein [Acetobacter garciniae]MBX0343644.1 hypothetical protein [Acetobacter garciniae]